MVIRFAKANWSLILIATALLALNFSLPPRNILAYDVFGYYLYLPMALIHHNLDFANMELVNRIVDQYKNTPTLYQLSWIDNQHYIIRYSIGQSILYLPLFLIGHLWAILSHFPADGFSKPYQWSIWIGSMWVTVAGFYFLQLVLRRFFNPLVVHLTLLSLFFGTNLLVHTGMFGLNAMSHNYLFFLYALLLYCTDQFARKNEFKYWYGSIFICGMMALVRPVEICSLLIPLLWTKTAGFSGSHLRQFLKPLIKSAFILLAIASAQMIYWKIYCGKFIVDSYYNPGEGFDFFSPHTFEYLFSFRKGWLVYTPIAGIAILGFISLYKNFPSHRSTFTALFATFVVSLYLASSWSVWWYSASFSSRAAIPAYALLALPLGALIAQFLKGDRNRFAVIGFFTLLTTLVFLNVFQSWQFKKGIIHPERMTRAAYFKNFLSTRPHPDTEGLLLIPRSETGNEIFDPKPYYSRKIVGLEDMEYGQEDSYVKSPSYQGIFVQELPAGAYSKGIRVPFNATTESYYSFLKISAYVYLPSESGEIKASLVGQMEHRGKTYFWRALNMESANLKKDQWQRVEFTYLTPEVRNETDLFKAYVWNRGEQKIYVDQIMVEAFY